MILLLPHKFLCEIIQCLVDKLYHTVDPVTSLFVKKVFTAEGVGVSDDLIHKLLDHPAVKLHVPDIHFAAEFIALLCDILHHDGETCLQLLFLNTAKQRKTKGTVGFRCSSLCINLCRLLQLADSQIHCSPSFRDRASDCDPNG